MNTEKIYFDNATLEKPALAQGELERNNSGGIESVVYSIHPKIADDIGAELFVHEFNEVAIFEALNQIVKGRPLSAISHNLNAESDGEYIEERNLLHEYIRSDRLPAIDKVFTIEETNEFRKRAYI